MQEIQVLNEILPFLAYVPGSTGALFSLYKAIGPEMPKDLKATSVKSHLPFKAPVKHFNYDEGHAGRFSVPDTDGASVAFDWVMQQPNPANFIMTNLAFYDKVDQPAVNALRQKKSTSSHNRRQVSEDGTGEQSTVDDDEQSQDEDIVDPTKQAEFIVFVPGLNTLHQPVEGETTTVQRLQHYVNVLGTLPMSQLHIGTSFDQGSVRVSHGGGRIMHILFNNALVPGSLKGSYEGDQMVWDARQIDRLQTALSKVNVIDTPIKESMRALFATSNVPDAAPVVVVTYSRASIEVEAALKKYIQNCVEDGESEEAIEERLRERVTIVTIGNATAGYPDGPAYIHLASWNDPLTKGSGTSENNNPDGGGRDAVFLHCNSPYHADAFDNHNFGALTSQFLAIVMAASEAKGFRELWDKGQTGDLIIPDNVDELTRAMIQVTRGYEWLWSADLAWKDVPFGALPEKEDAVNMLRENMGDAFVDRLLSNFDS